MVSKSNHDELEKSINDIDINKLGAYWDTISEKEQANLIKQSEKLNPGIAIQFVLKGLNSYHFSVRTQARKTLKILQTTISANLKDPSDKSKWLQGMKDSASVCSRLFALININMSFEEQRYFFKTLLGFEGKGAFFAFQAFYTRRISLDSIMKIILAVPDSYRLEFIREYLLTTPEIRLKFGAPFKKIVQSVKKKDAVIIFYSRLFDAEQDVDPFLYNLNPKLRDPGFIISDLVHSKSPEIRIAGLKALEMMTDKIPFNLLLEVLEKETNSRVRRTIYKIVENSSLGTYPEVFHPILKILKESNEKEAFHAFKALLVSGNMPLIEVLEIVGQSQPGLMKHINKEISELSKISFFFIQDIALNQEAYTGSNIGINHAAVFGMIKKRPERVIEIFKDHISEMDTSIKKNIAGFVKKTKQLLAKETQSIKKEFDPIIQEVKALQSIQPGGMLKSFFSASGMKKKMATLKANTKRQIIDFKGHAIIDTDLSSIKCFQAPVYFNESIIKDSNLSGASLLNVSFKKCILYNVDLQKTKFESVSFDDAVFINVNASDTEFKNCSFQNISIYDSNFNNAVMNSSFFIGSTISKSSFQGTDLSSSSFAYSQICATSFVSSNLEQTDFSGIKARFTRFPSHARSLVVKNDIDLNARKYQLKISDIPQLDQTLLTPVNMLIFSEFIHYGEMKFSRQNKYSLITAFDIFKTKQADLFQIIPYLLHENNIFPEIKEKFHASTPHGIFDYHPSHETIEIIYKYTKKRKDEISPNQSPAIEGLFTIGSIGSVAQADDSDIDYWVCICEDRFNKKDIERLEKKLKAIEQLALDQFNIQVTFFLVDILKTRNNDFGDSTFESSGSAQAMLLKEEFYRTMIHVAGKLPLWSVLPTTISFNFYQSIMDMSKIVSNISRYIDLGDIHSISPGEFFGASIWQMFKSLKSPFKSVIKMALIEKFVKEYGQKPLLCSTYKDEWMNSGVNIKLSQNDAYIILLKKLLKFYKESEDNESVSLLLTCFFLKLGISKNQEIDNTVFGLRKIFLENCLKNWKWSRQRMLKIGNYKTWSYKKIAGLSYILETYMVKKYKFLNKSFEQLSSGGASISPEDRTVLGRKIYSELSRQKGKIEKVLLVSKSDKHFTGLHLKYVQTQDKKGVWKLLNKGISLSNKAETLITASTIEEIGAWLVVNKIYNDSCIVSLLPNSTQVTADDVRKLLYNLDAYFSAAMKNPVSFDHLLEKANVANLFLSLNFYAKKPQKEITDFTIIYLNSWGEMFIKPFQSEKGHESIKEVKIIIQKKLGMDSMPSHGVIYSRGKTKKIF